MNPVKIEEIEEPVKKKSEVIVCVCKVFKNKKGNT